MESSQGHDTPLPYLLIRWIFTFALKVFYGAIVIENEGYLPKAGQSCIICANHTNSLTDALLLMTTSKTFLRLTAKSTLFGKPTLTSRLIEWSGALPIKRRMDYDDTTEVDNTSVMNSLYQALEQGDTVCLFPEGMSRYRPALMPLKTGVARIISEVLTRRRDDPNFEITLLTCSITYMQRQHFRSDVLLTFHPPVKFRPQESASLLAPVDFRAIKYLTARMADQISAGTLDAPSWDVITIARIAAKIYAPLGTVMSLGDHVRVVRAFIEGFKKTGKGWERGHQRSLSWDELDVALLGDNSQRKPTDEDHARWEEAMRRDREIDLLAKDLLDYRNNLLRLGIRDDRIRVGPLLRRVLLWRMLVRTFWLCVLSAVSLPGLILWCPVFVVISWTVARLKKTGSQEDVWDEIAQQKLLVGLLGGPCVWLGCVLLMLSVAPMATFILVPCLMWMSLRFLEDAISTFRALRALTKLLWLGKQTLLQLSNERQQLHRRVMDLAVETLKLPSDPERYFWETGGREKGRVRSSWESNVRYFSIRRRRKRDWNEILRIWPHDA